MTIRFAPATFAWAAGLCAASILASSAAMAQQSQALKEIPADKAKLTGAMTVDYNSRSLRSTAEPISTRLATLRWRT